jgi:uncharacterized membrane protein
MSSIKSTNGSPLALSLNLAGLLALMAYPFVVYFGLGRFSPRVMVAGLVALLSLRMILSRGQGRGSRLPYLFGGAGLIILAAHSPTVGLKAYPVLISLALAAMFGYSLLRPPTIIEQIVRVRRPEMPPAIVAYLRNVTLVWLAFFLINASISTVTALSGNMKLWALYNGFISYLMIGGLLLGEFALRPAVDDPAGHG